MAMLIVFGIFVFMIFSAVAIFKVKSGKNKSFSEAFVAVIEDVWHFCNSAENVSNVLYPPPIDEHLWLGFEKKIKNKFVDIDFSTFCVSNGVCCAKFAVVQSSASDVKILRKMLENSLRNYILQSLNLHRSTFFSIFVYLHGHELCFYYAITDSGFRFIEQQKSNERSRQRPT